MAEERTEKQAKAWADFSAQLSPAARAALGADQEAAAAPASLSAAAAALLEDLPIEPEAPDRWILFICREGEPPICRLVSRPEAVAQQLAAQDGGDTFIRIALGRVVPFTQGPRRLILLGDGQAVTVPNFPGDEPQFVEAPEDAVVQDDGYLGPVAFSQSHLPATLAAFEPKNKKRKPKPPRTPGPEDL